MLWELSCILCLNSPFLLKVKIYFLPLINKDIYDRRLFPNEKNIYVYIFETLIKISFLTVKIKQLVHFKVVLGFK